MKKSELNNIYEFKNGIIYNDDTIHRMQILEKEGIAVDVILTSPPYNTQRNLDDRTYDIYKDSINNINYLDWTINIFECYDKLLNKDGVILYNLSYGNENPSIMFEVINRIISDTPFIIADVITWKKKNAMPNNMSHNKLTRFTEYIYVICRKDEYYTFKTNREVASIRKNGQKTYRISYNFIEAKNNDGVCKLNKSTYSTELCDALLKEYLPSNGICLDNFSGTGTTLVSVDKLDGYFIGIEISKAQCEYSRERILNEREKRI